MMNSDSTLRVDTLALFQLIQQHNLITLSPSTVSVPTANTIFPLRMIPASFKFVIIFIRISALFNRIPYTVSV